MGHGSVGENSNKCFVSKLVGKFDIVFFFVCVLCMFCIYLMMLFQLKSLSGLEKLGVVYLSRLRKT